MQNYFSGADCFAGPSDCIRVTFRNRLVIRCCGQSCSIRRADRQVLQETLASLLKIAHVLDCLADFDKVCADDGRGLAAKSLDEILSRPKRRKKGRIR